MSLKSVPIPRDPFPPGLIVGGKYRVLRRLGAGGVGVVVEAEHLKLRQRVAISVRIGGLWCGRYSLGGDFARNILSLGGRIQRAGCVCSTRLRRLWRIL